MEKKKKALLFLLVAPIIFNELLSGTLPVVSFLNPLVILVFIVGYGLAVIGIREIYVKYDLNIFGLFILGLAYAFYNEGLVAKTLLLNIHVPIPSFDGYGYFFGINFGWTIFIGVWHAFLSVVFPIVIAHALFPGIKKESWVGFRGKWFILVTVFLLGTVEFFLSFPVKANPIFYPVFLFVITGLVFLSLQFSKSGENSEAFFAWRYVLAGIFFPLYFIILGNLSRSGRPLLIYFFLAAVMLVGILNFFKKRERSDGGPLAFFALGCVISTSALGTINAVTSQDRPEKLLIGIIFELIFIFLIFKIKKRERVMTGEMSKWEG